MKIISTIMASSAVLFTVNAVHAADPIPTKSCLPPYHIVYRVAKDDKRQVTLTWETQAKSDPVIGFQINRPEGTVLWRGTSFSFTDTTLPGTKGTFVYYLWAVCTSGISFKPYRKTVYVT